MSVHGTPLLTGMAPIYESVSMDIWFTQHAGRPEFSQQDSILVAGKVFQGRDLSVRSIPAELNGMLVGVADGVSASPSADQASRLVLQLLQTVIRNRPDLLDHGLLGSRIVAEVGETFRLRLAKGRSWGAATTLAVMHVQGGRAAILNCGDSRVYRIRSDTNGQPEWRQLSKDHTVLEELRATGAITAGDTDAYASIYSGLAHCIVADPEEGDIHFYRRIVDLVPGDVFLLTTDGVHETLGDPQLQDLYNPGKELSEQVVRWREAALGAGSPDNLTLAAFRVPE